MEDHQALLNAWVRAREIIINEWAGMSDYDSDMRALHAEAAEYAARHGLRAPSPADYD